MTLLFVIGGAVPGTCSGVSIWVSRLSSVLVGRAVVLEVHSTRKLWIEPPVPGGFDLVDCVGAICLS